MNYILISETNDPYFNIATEEYLLKNFSDNFLFIYRNETSVIVGKHQNVFAEVNLMDVWKQNIPIVRRITGGGTVYHDLGNMNFSFVETGEKGKLIDFKKYLTPVIGFLKTIGIDAVIGEKNELKVGGAKVSGNAEHVYRNRLVHHGTLLFDANLNKLKEYFKSFIGKLCRFFGEVEQEQGGKYKTAVEGAYDNRRFYCRIRLFL